MRFACRSVLLAHLVLAGASAAKAEKRAMVVHLPDAPIESMSRLAEGVTALAEYLQSSVRDLTLEVKAFRKSDDARDFLASTGDGAAIVVCDAPFLLDLPDGYEAAHRFVRRGREAGRKIVVVKKESGLDSLASLKGATLITTIGTSEPLLRFLAESVFRGEIDPGRWFGAIVQETDDFTAIAAVLYGRAHAALVSDDNPLLSTHLDKELASIYTSPPLSLPIVAVRPSALSTGQLSALDAALEVLGSRPETEPIRAVLAIDGFRAIDGVSRRTADLLSGPSARRELEIAVPAGSLPPLPAEFPPLPPGSVPFSVGVELPEVAIPPELVDSVLPAGARGK